VAPLTSPEAPYGLGDLRLKLRFTLYWRGSFTAAQSSVNPKLTFVQPPLQLLALDCAPHATRRRTLSNCLEEKCRGSG
jgi:hypothetical protein